ncbi:hypothetical protein ACHAXA_007072 [Cyclostephanos tholiformis]|uniref:Sulfotransferase domain-containing protein n=1 Tax=Cyclostephanos tholiformis TaxID=382380 RepID=A0ABD3R8W1_9STRA
MIAIRSRSRWLVALCGAIYLYSFHLFGDDDEVRRQPEAGVRRLSNALPNGGCEITWPKKPPRDVEITYAASYPGCGARMTWNLVEALTGLETGDDWNNNGRGDEVVTVKTHYPQSNGILVDFDERIKRVFVVIRNPMKSIPSFFNHIYEMRNHLPVHSERAPLEEWTKWRDAYLDIEIAEYKKFIMRNRLLITYEGLTDNLIGPQVAKGLNEFLGKARGVTPIHSDSVACIWRAVVKNEPPENQAAQIKKLQAQALNQPLGTYQKKTEQEKYLRNTAILMQTPEVVPAELARPQEAQHKQLPSNQQAPTINGNPADAHEVDVDPLDLLMEKMQKALARGKVLQTRNQLEKNQGGQQNGQLQKQGEMQNEMPQYDLSHRRLDPGHHNSQRGGPDVPRPYLPRQLDNMMNMLLEVANRYEKTDVRLYHIMMGYCEQVRSERAKLNSDEPLNVKSHRGFF